MMNLIVSGEKSIIFQLRTSINTRVFEGLKIVLKIGFGECDVWWKRKNISHSNTKTEPQLRIIEIE